MFQYFIRKFENFLEKKMQKDLEVSIIRHNFALGS